MLLLLLTIFIFAAIIIGIGDGVKKTYTHQEIAIKDYYDYNHFKEEKEALRQLEISTLGKLNTFFKGIDNVFTGLCGISMVGVGLILLFMLLLWSPQIDKKIALYEEENLKIEIQIATVINQYQEFELNVITECTPESAMMLVSLYPELKSDALVAKQIEVYVANNEKIKELKEEEINQSVIGWWFNFNAW